MANSTLIIDKSFVDVEVAAKRPLIEKKNSKIVAANSFTYYVVLLIFAFIALIGSSSKLASLGATAKSFLLDFGTRTPKIHDIVCPVVRYVFLIFS